MPRVQWTDVQQLELDLADRQLETAGAQRPHADVPPEVVVDPATAAEAARGRPSLDALDIGDDEDDVAARTRSREYLDPVDAQQQSGLGYAPHVLGPALASDDPLDPQVMYNAITLGLSANAEEDNRNRYLNHRKRTISIKKVKRMYENNEQDNLLDLLRTRTKIEVPPSVKVPIDSRDCWPTINRAVYDFVLFCPKEEGCGLILPDNDVEGDYEVSVSFHDRHWQYRNRKGELGFPAAGRMLRGGEYNNMDLWFVLAPVEYFALEEPRGDSERKHDDAADDGNTSIPDDLFYPFLALLGKGMGEKGIGTVANTVPYPDIRDKDAFNSQCSILKTGARDTLPIKLKKRDVKELHAIMQGYEKYMENAPDHWPKDKLLSVRPACFLMRYGQNVDIELDNANLAAQKAQAVMFNNLVNWDDVRFFSFAVASQIAVKLVSRWGSVPLETIRANHGDRFYSHADCEDDDLIEDLANYPLRDDDGAELLVYDAEGYIVEREQPFVSPDPKESECGVLLDLAMAHNAFRSPENDPYVEAGFAQEPPHATPHIDLYPLGHVSGMGNVQVRGISTGAHSAYASLNRKVLLLEFGDEIREGQPGVEDEELVIPEEYTPVVKGQHTQCYATYVHTTRPSHKHDEVTNGAATSAAGGSYWVNTYDKKKHETAKNLVKVMPHERNAAKMLNPEINKTFRMEMVNVVNMQKLTTFSGRTVWREIILRLAKLYREPEVFEDIRHCLIVIRPKYFPGIIIWSMAPWMVALEVLYAVCRRSFRQAPNSPINPYLLNVISMAERGLAWGWTGNASVISNGLMRWAWMLWGMQDTGMPALIPDIVINRTVGFAIKDYSNWPTNTKTNMPLSSVDKALTLTYHGRVLKHYLAVFQVYHVRHLPVPADIRATTLDPDTRRIRFLARTLAAGYVQAVRNEVAEALETEHNQGVQAAGNPSRSRTFHLACIADLKTWSEPGDKPAKSYKPLKLSSMAPLLRALRRRDDDVIHKPPYSTHKPKQAIDTFARALLSSVQQSQGQPRFGVAYPRGFFPFLAQAVFAEAPRFLTSQHQSQRPDLLTILADHFVEELIVARVEAVPGPRKSGVTRIDARSWTKLVLPDAPIQELAPVYLDAAQAKKRKAEDELRKQTLDVPGARWSIAEYGLESLSLAMHKLVPPDEWYDLFGGLPDEDGEEATDEDEDDAAEDLDIKKAHEWGREEWRRFMRYFLDLRNIVHRIGMVVACAYFLQWPKTTADKLKSEVEGRAYHRLLRATPWVNVTTKSKTKTTSSRTLNREHYVFYVCTYFIALYDQRLPSAQRMKQGDDRGKEPKGGVWDKVFRETWGDYKVRAYEFAHMDLVEAKGKGVFHPAKYLACWRRYKWDVIDAKYRRWEAAMEVSKEKGATTILADLFGSQEASDVAMAALQESGKAHPDSGRPRKRSRRKEKEADVDEDEEADEEDDD